MLNNNPHVYMLKGQPQNTKLRRDKTSKNSPRHKLADTT